MKHLLARLHRAFRPAALLRLERVHLHRQFRGYGHVRKENKFPPFYLGSVAKVKVLRKGVVLPPAGILNRLSADYSRCSVEIKEAADSRSA